MREDFISEFCDRYWDGLSARPDDAANFADCERIVASVVDAMLWLEGDRDAANEGAAAHDERFDEIAHEILSLLRASPEVATVGLLERAAVDLVASLVNRVAVLEDRDPRAVLHDFVPHADLAHA